MLCRVRIACAVAESCTIVSPPGVKAPTMLFREEAPGTAAGEKSVGMMKLLARDTVSG